MPSRQDIHYFGAGPAPLPTQVVESAAQAFTNFNDTGLGLAEISHRSPTANKILTDTKSALTSLLDIPDNYEILFLQGGGSGQFSAVVYNLVNVWVVRRQAQLEKELRAEVAGKDNQWYEEETLRLLKNAVDKELVLDYLVTGSWSLKASQEAVRLLGKKRVNVAVDAREHHNGKFGKIPSEETWKLTKSKKEGGKGAALTYFCDNETVDGVEFPAFPKGLEATGLNEDEDRLVVADMSSNILSRRVDVRKYAVIFAGAQKNIGTTGITLAIVRKSLLPPQVPSPPATLLSSLNLPIGPIILDYPTIAKNNSLYNTIPIFDIWIAGRVMSNLLETFQERKVSGMEDLANKKASLLYGALDNSPDVYNIVPLPGNRSRMNICFRVYNGDTEKETLFLKGAEERSLAGLKGHRSVGGIRASNYNAVSLEAVKKLADYIWEFAKST